MKITLKCLLLSLTLIIACTSSAIAEDESFMTPESFRQYSNDRLQNNMLLLEAIKERNRQDQYREQNPYAQCISMGEVEGQNIEGAKSLARQLGATNIQFLQTTATKVRAIAYKCP